MSTRIAVAAFLLVCGLPRYAAAPGRAAGGGLRGSPSDRTVSAKEVESSLQEAFDVVLQGGSSVAAKRLARIEAAMWETFQALPKNELGRLAPRAVRHIVHSYFAKEHGWLINGLDPHGLHPNVSEVHEVDILQDKAPVFVEALLEARRANHGLSLNDVVAMAAALERLIVEESIALLRAAYTLNGHTVVDRLDVDAIHEVLSSYLLVFEMGIRGNVTDIGRHQAIKRALAKSGGNWNTLIEFERDAVHNFDFESHHRTNPFVARQYSFGAASLIVEGLAQDYGKWQNTECRQMREGLMDLDPEGAGLVPLKAFYSQPESADYQFTESVDYLSKIGAYDKASNSVRIANYMIGPSNCIAKSTYYSVCCLSDCEGLMNDLERTIQAPVAPPDHLLDVVANLTSAPDMRLTKAAARARLRSIAEHSGGEVPMHGRLFAEFLHYAFPLDCPYPQVVEDVAVLTPGHWSSNRATAPEEERHMHMEAEQVGGMADTGASVVWSEEEVVPVLEPPKRSRSALSGVVLSTMQVAATLAVLRSALTGLRVAVGTGNPCKEKAFVLPVRI